MFFFCKQKTAYEMRISDWSSDVCSSDLSRPPSTAATTCALRRHTHRVVLGGGKLSSVSVSPDGPVTDAGRNLIFSSTSTLRSCGHAAVVPPALLPRRRRCATRVKNVLARPPAYAEPFRLAGVLLVDRKSVVEGKR